MHQRVHIHGLVVDPLTERPILVLKGDTDDRVLPIWIGQFEANAIALRQEKIQVPRPMTHDLLCGMLARVGTPVKEVLIRDLQDNTYYADIVLLNGKDEIRVDARPSDAVALALRVGAPIFVEEDLFERVCDPDDAHGGAEQLLRWLDQLSPDELGTYEM